MKKGISKVKICVSLDIKLYTELTKICQETDAKISTKINSIIAEYISNKKKR
jgi:hypothetical protein